MHISLGIPSAVHWDSRGCLPLERSHRTQGHREGPRQVPARRHGRLPVQAGDPHQPGSGRYIDREAAGEGGGATLHGAFGWCAVADVVTEPRSSPSPMQEQFLASDPNGIFRVNNMTKQIEVVDEGEKYKYDGECIKVRAVAGPGSQVRLRKAVFRIAVPPLVAAVRGGDRQAGPGGHPAKNGRVCVPGGARRTA